MQWLYDVHGDHPIFKRVDELQLNEVEKNDIVAELKKLNYDNIEINKDIYFEAGDEIDITSSMYEDNKDEEAKRLIFSILFDKANNLNIRDLGVDVGYDSDKLEEIRESTNKSWVLGSGQFRERIEELTARQAQPKGRGGDRKSKKYKESKINRV